MPFCCTRNLIAATAKWVFPVPGGPMSSNPAATAGYAFTKRSTIRLATRCDSSHCPILNVSKLHASYRRGIRANRSRSCFRCVRTHSQRSTNSICSCRLTLQPVPRQRGHTFDMINQQLTFRVTLYTPPVTHDNDLLFLFKCQITSQIPRMTSQRSVLFLSIPESYFLLYRNSATMSNTFLH